MANLKILKIQQMMNRTDTTLDRHIKVDQTNPLYVLLELHMTVQKRGKFYRQQDCYCTGKAARKHAVSVNNTTINLWIPI